MIGSCNTVWLRSMREAPLYFLERPLEERLKKLVAEYGANQKQDLISAVQKIERRLGGKRTQEIVQHFEKNELLEAATHLLSITTQPTSTPCTNTSAP